MPTNSLDFVGLKRYNDRLRHFRMFEITHKLVHQLPTSGMRNQTDAVSDGCGIRRMRNQTDAVSDGCGIRRMRYQTDVVSDGCGIRRMRYQTDAESDGCGIRQNQTDPGRCGCGCGCGVMRSDVKLEMGVWHWAPLGPLHLYPTPWAYGTRRL